MKRRRLKLVLIALLASLAVGLISVTVLIWDGLSDHIGHADVCLVLGNKVHADGKPSDRLLARLDRAVELHKQGHIESIIVSGAMGKEGHDEARVMQTYLIGQGIPEEQIIADSKGFTTYDSARNTEAIMRERGFSSVMVVTQYFHIPRSRHALKRFGIDPVYTAHARHFEGRDAYSIPREILGMIKYLFRSYEPAS